MEQPIQKTSRVVTSGRRGNASWALLYLLFCSLSSVCTHRLLGASTQPGLRVGKGGSCHSIPTVHALGCTALICDPWVIAVTSLRLSCGVQCLGMGSADSRDSEKGVVTVLGSWCVSNTSQPETLRFRPFTADHVGPPAGRGLGHFYILCTWHKCLSN